MRIFLIGFMGSGKTTVGRPLAGALGLHFVDMDHYLAETQHKTIGEIFEAIGESGFRALERQTLAELSLAENTLVATGGGAPCFSDNIQTMNRAGTTIYLQLSPEGLAARLQHGRDKRPLLRGLNDEELLSYIRTTLAQREPFYGQARIIVDCDGYSDAQIVEKCKKAVEFMPRNTK
ncbi:MAG: shikimate kinase [Rikenellaceae bacterium]|jgi:shikimate kinase|nr:shikimate kinase [Rikenellaceae bacterium]